MLQVRCPRQSSISASALYSEFESIKGMGGNACIVQADVCVINSDYLQYCAGCAFFCPAHASVACVLMVDPWRGE